MDNYDNSHVKLFGIRINNTLAVIIVFLIIPFFIDYLRQFFLAIYSVIQMNFIFQMEGVTISPFLINILINNWIYIFTSIIKLAVFTYILIICSKIKNLKRETEEKQISWFDFKLNKISSITIGNLSILSIIILIISFIDNISPFLLVLPSSLISNFLIIIERLALLLIYIYTIIVSRKANKVLNN